MKILLELLNLLETDEPELSADEFQAWYDNAPLAARDQCDRLFDTAGLGLGDHLSARECYMRSYKSITDKIIDIVKRYPSKK